MTTSMKQPHANPLFPFFFFPRFFFHFPPSLFPLSSGEISNLQSPHTKFGIKNYFIFHSYFCQVRPTLVLTAFSLPPQGNPEPFHCLLSTRSLTALIIRQSNNIRMHTVLMFNLNFINLGDSYFLYHHKVL